MTTKKANITKTVVDRLKPGDVVWDTQTLGFGVRCQSKAKVYVLKKYYNGKQHWFSLGKQSEGITVNDARKKAEIYLGQIADGKDPAQIRENRKNRPTIAEMCERFLTDYAEEHKKPSSIRMDRKNINNHIIPLLGNRFVTDISLDDIDSFKRAVKDGKTAKPLPPDRCGGSAIMGGPGAANRCLSLLSKAFNLSIRWGWRETNPVQHIQKYKETKIERFLSETEFAALASAIKSEEDKETSNPYAIAAIRLLIFTGARRSEILTMRWNTVDFDRKVLKLDDSKTGSKVIYLNPPALELLSILEKQKDNPYVICGLKPNSHLYDVNRAWRNIRERASLNLYLQMDQIKQLIDNANLDATTLTFKTLKSLAEQASIELSPSLTDLRLHDLRHSFASVAVGGGMSLPMIGKLLGHTQAATTARYAHLADNPLKEANDLIGRRIDQLMNTKEKGNIVKLGDRNE